jgi:anaerobic selenocysteine-containing dehydrogenase
MPITGTGRRDFLKLSGILGGAVGMHVTGVRRLGVGDLQAQVAPDEWIPTTCMMCGGTTGVLAHVVKGRVVKIEP